MSFIKNLPDLGVGIGFRPPFLAGLFSHRSTIDFLEITADHYYVPSLRKERELDLLLANFPLIPHGLGLSLGSADGIDPDYLKRFASIVAKTKPAWCSEHISFTKAGGIDIGHLTPIPKTKASLDVLSENIARVQDVIQVPLILENITETITYPDEEFTEGEFLAHLCERSEVGLLLDLTNLFINAKNNGHAPAKRLRELPLDRVVQLHFVGYHETNGEIHDQHSDTTQSEIWDLFELVMQLSPVKGAILERDENLPPLAELVEELQIARGYYYH